MDKKELSKLIDGVLASAGFVKKSMSWYRSCPDLIQVLDLQKSNYGDLYHVNLAFAPRGLAVDGLPHPKVHKCPLQVRATALLPPRQELERLFNLEEERPSRAEEIRCWLADIVVPFFAQHADVPALREAVQSGAFVRGMVDVELKQYLGIGK